MSKKQRIINWLSIFLLVINISAFTTILVLNNKSSSQEETAANYFKSDAFLKEELNLSDKQFAEIERMDYQVFRSYQIILDIQCETNFSLLEELSKDEPDLIKMDSIATKIGKHHASLKRQTIKHFLNLRKICNEEQTVLLNQLIKNMMKLDDQCKYCNKVSCSRRESLNKK